MDYQQLLETIKNNQINLDDIENLNISEIDKTIFLFAYYEFNKLGIFSLKLLKDKKQEFSNDLEALRIINRLTDRLKQKIKIFDIYYFLNLLNQSQKSKKNYSNSSLETPKPIEETRINDDFFIKELKELWNTKEYKKILDVCNKKENKIYKDNLNVQVFRVKALIALELFEEALIICRNPIFKNDAAIKYEEIKVLSKLERYTRAYEICKNPKFQIDATIQLFHVKLLIFQQRFDEAIKICERKRLRSLQKFIILKLIAGAHLNINLFAFEHDVLSTEYIIDLLNYLILKHEFCLIVDICKYDKFNKNPSIQMFNIKALLALGKIEEAINVCKRKAFKNNIDIQYEYINILIYENINLEEALNVCNRDFFKDVEVFQNLEAEIKQILIERLIFDLKLIQEKKGVNRKLKKY